MTSTHEETTPHSPPSAKQLSLTGRMAGVALGGLALVLAGMGVTYASATDNETTGDTAWVTVEDDTATNTADCPNDDAKDGL